MAPATEASPKPGAGASEPLGAAPLALLFAAFAALALAVYGPALRGPFVSDDLHYVATNPWVHDASLRSVIEIFRPWGPSSVFVVNYTPLHLLGHLVAWRLFGPDVFGHHVVNVVLHALAATLLVRCFADSGIHRAAAGLGGALFLMHPANVEAVAWISQLKTSLCLVLSLATLLAFPRRPGLATPLFFLAMLAKPTASFLLPTAAVLAFVRCGRGRIPWRHVAWLAVWTAGFAVLAVAQLEVNRRNGTPDLPLHPELAVRLRTVATIALRYLEMAASSVGVSAWHEPAPVLSPVAPRFLVALVVLGAAAARATWALVRRREEAMWWTFAAASFVPVSQLFPFLYPMADRYLYFLLPGLYGAGLLALQGAIARAPSRARRPLARGALAAGLALALVFGVRSHARAALWAQPVLLLVDAARNYPDGVSAQLLRARRAAQEGDAETAVAALRAASARGFNRFEQLQSDPAWAPVRRDPRFQALIADMAQGWIDRLAALPDPSQLELRTLAIAHLARGEDAEAAALLERALGEEGPLADQIRQELDAVRRRAAERDAGK